MAILSYAGRRTRRLARGRRGVFDPGHEDKILSLLDLLQHAASLSDLRVPGARLHPLKHDPKGFWALDVSGSLRLVFRFASGNAYDVFVTDYHRS